MGYLVNDGFLIRAQLLLQEGVLVLAASTPKSGVLKSVRRSVLQMFRDANRERASDARLRQPPTK